MLSHTWFSLSENNNNKHAHSCTHACMHVHTHAHTHTHTHTHAHTYTFLVIIESKTSCWPVRYYMLICSNKLALQFDLRFSVSGLKSPFLLANISPSVCLMLRHDILPSTLVKTKIHKNHQTHPTAVKMFMLAAPWSWRKCRGISGVFVL